MLLGVVSALKDALSGRPDALKTAGFSVFFFCGFGVLWLLAAAMIRRSRIDGFDQHLSVVSGFRKARAVRPDAIGRLRLEVQSRNGISFETVVGWHQRGRRRVVRATRGHPGSDDVEAWFASRCPKEWAALG